MTKRGKDTEIAEVRGPINGLIVDYMRRNNVQTVRDFADIVGIGRTTIYDLVRGRNTANGAWMKPSLDTIVQLASVLQKPTHELLYLIEPEAYGVDVPMASDVFRVPIVGFAGAGSEQLVSNFGDNFDIDVTYVEATFARNRDLVAFEIAGDSMDGGKHPIHNGDLVIVDRNIGGEVNSAVVARLNSDGYVCKRLRPGNFLDSSNPDFLDPELAVITPDRIAQVMGKVVRVIYTLP